MITGLLLILAEAFNVYDYTQLEELIESQDYGTALHLIRINEGLYSEAQLSILDMLAKDDPDKLYTALEVARKHYGAGSIEAADRLITLSRHAITKADINELWDLVYLFNQGDTPEASFKLFLGKAEVYIAILRLIQQMPISEFQGPLNSNMYAMADSKSIEVSRVYAYLRSTMKDAAPLARELGRADEYNQLINQIQLINH